jgi:hypothetical protein
MCAGKTHGPNTTGVYLGPLTFILDTRPDRPSPPTNEKHFAQKFSTSNFSIFVSPEKGGVFRRFSHQDKNIDPYENLRPRAPGTSKKT